MNKDKRLLLICIVVILGLMGCNIYLQYENDKLTKEKDNVKEEVTDNTTNIRWLYSRSTRNVLCSSRSIFNT